MSKLLIEPYLKAKQMSSVIVPSLGEIEEIDFARQHLETCLQGSKQSEKAELTAFYMQLAYTENKTIEEIYDYIRKINSLLIKVKKRADKAKNASDPIKTVKLLVSVHNLFVELVNNYWDYLPPKAKQELDNLQKNIKKQHKSIYTSYIAIKIVLLLNQFMPSEALLTAYRKSSIRLADAISEAVAQDLEDKLDLEKACAARKRIEKEGTISWEELKRELNLP